MKHDIVDGSITPEKNIAIGNIKKAIHPDKTPISGSEVDYITDYPELNSGLEYFNDILPEVANISAQDTNISPKKTRLDALNLQTITINSDELINNHYMYGDLLNDRISNAGEQFRVVLINSGLGTAKSTSTSQMMRDHYNGFGVAVSHRVRLTSQLCSSFDSVTYQDVKKSEGGEKLERIGTTAQSLATIINNPICEYAFNGGLLVIDESNSVADEFTGKTIKNEAATMSALRQAINKSRTTICLDAHMDRSTVGMLRAAGVRDDEILLINVKKPELEGYTVNIFETELDSNGKSLTKPALINQIIDDLRKGKKVIVTSLSANFLDVLDRQIKKSGLYDSIKITSETKKSVSDSLNADTYGDYQVVMLSPSMTTGISFDKHNADECYVFLSNNNGTGSYQDGLQATMRDRAIKSKTINCIYEEGKNPLTTTQEVMIQKDRTIMAFESIISKYGLEEQFNQVRPRANEVNDFLWSQMVKQAEEKQDFLNLFIREIRAKGAIVQKCGASEFAEGETTGAILAADKKEVEQLRVESIVNAERLDDDVELSDDVDIKPIKERAKIEKFAAVDFDSMPELERVELVNKVAPADEQKSCINRIRKIERSFIPAADLKRQVEIAVVGARNDESDRANFAEKITTRKIHWIDQAHYTKLALKACGVTDGDSGLVIAPASALDENSVKGNTPAKALYLSLKRNPERAITCGMLGGKVTSDDIDDIKKNTFQYMVNLIQGLGIKLKKSRGKDQYMPDADFLQYDVDMINRRKSAGIDESKAWLIKIDEYLQAHQARKSKAASLNQAALDKVPDTVSAAVSVALEKIGQIDLLHEAVEYLEPFHSRIQKKKLSMIEIEYLVRRFTDNQ